MKTMTFSQHLAQCASSLPLLRQNAGKLRAELVLILFDCPLGGSQEALDTLPPFTGCAITWLSGQTAWAYLLPKELRDYIYNAEVIA
jgi:hypothetical protein